MKTLIGVIVLVLAFSSSAVGKTSRQLKGARLAKQAECQKLATLKGFRTVSARRNQFVRRCVTPQ